MAVYDVNGNPLASDGGSPLAGKKILMIGDSNIQYSGDGIKSYIEETYGCRFSYLAKAGIGWEYNAWDGETAPRDITEPCGVGYVNTILNDLGDATYIANYDIIVIMLGTNCWNMGTPSDLSSNIGTMCGAMRYCMEKLCYYGRKIKLGVIIPLRNDDNYNPSASLMPLPQKFQYVKEIARQFAVPTLDIWDEGRIIPEAFTPDGTSYYLGDAVHMGGNGSDQFKIKLGEWLAYTI